MRVCLFYSCFMRTFRSIAVLLYVYTGFFFVLFSLIHLHDRFSLSLNSFVTSFLSFPPRSSFSFLECTGSKGILVCCFNTLAVVLIAVRVGYICIILLFLSISFRPPTLSKYRIHFAFVLTSAYKFCVLLLLRFYMIKLMIKRNLFSFGNKTSFIRHKIFGYCLLFLGQLLSFCSCCGMYAFILLWHSFLLLKLNIIAPRCFIIVPTKLLLSRELFFSFTILHAIATLWKQLVWYLRSTFFGSKSMDLYHTLLHLIVLFLCLLFSWLFCVLRSSLHGSSRGFIPERACC